VFCFKDYQQKKLAQRPTSFLTIQLKRINQLMGSCIAFKKYTF
jgi:hypothetical protein